MKWFARYTIFSNEGGIVEQREIPTYTCTDEDYKLFYPVDKSSKRKLDNIVGSPTRSMICIDWKNQNVNFFGSESSGDYAELDLIIMPCNVKLT